MSNSIIIQNEWELNKIKENLKNPKQGDTYIWYRNHKAVKLVIGLVKNKNLRYFIDGKKFKITINELYNIINSVFTESIEFYNHYEYQKYIEEEKLKSN